MPGLTESLLPEGGRKGCHAFNGNQHFGSNSAFQNGLAAGQGAFGIGPSYVHVTQIRI
jgi:hypothetical protein